MTKAQMPNPGSHTPALERQRSVASHSYALPGLFITVALMAIAWFDSFTKIWSTRWFPTWGATDTSLMHRLTGGDSYYTHGPLVPLTCLAIAIYIYRRVGVPTRRSAGATALGWLILAGSIMLHLLAVYGRIKFISAAGLIGSLGGIVLIWGGWPLARAYWMPVVFLSFMVPLPMSTIAGLNMQLKLQASGVAVWLTNAVCGVPVMLDGSYLYLVPDVPGTTKMLIVENVCGGLRSLIALTFFSALFAMVCRVKGVWRWLMLAMAVPVALACNVLRIVALNLAAHFGGVEAAGEGSLVHQWSGILAFALALAILFALEGAIIGLSKWLKRDWTDRRLLPFLTSMPPGSGSSPATMRPVLLLTLAVTAAASTYLAALPIAQNISTTAQAAVPKTLNVGAQVFASHDIELEQRVLDILETDDYLLRSFRAADSTDAIDVLIVFSTNIRNGAHSPEVCLEGTGHRITSSRLFDMDVPGYGMLTFRELVSESNGRQMYHLYAYRAGDTYTTSYIHQQMAVFTNGLLQRDTTGALIHFTVPVNERRMEETKTFAVQAVGKLMASVHPGLSRTGMN